ncbi:MAG: C25 family cysteine peptidase [Candidatus Pacearchaeota archaeon]
MTFRIFLYLIFGLILTIISIPITYAIGQVIISPNPVERGSFAKVTIIPNGKPMDSVGAIFNAKTGERIGNLIIFENCSNFKCSEPRTAIFYVDKYLFGNYYISVYDENLKDFVKGYFSTIPNKCENGLLDDGESDIDCGGEKCPKCPNNKNCLFDSDCESNFCNKEKKCQTYFQIFEKNKDRYSEREIFLVSDEDWKTVLKIVPISIWNQYNRNTEEYEIKKFPTLIYHKESNKFDADSIIQFIQDYSPTRVTIFGETPKKLDKLLISKKNLGAELSDEQIKKISINDYFSYWENFNSVVLSEENYETGLISSLFASYKNSPLIFENELDYGILKDKDVFIVGNISKEKIENIKKIAKKVNIYTTFDLQKEYIKQTNTDKIIVVNPNDIEFKLNKDFSTKKSSKIKYVYSKNSIASIFLASAKKEIIIFTKINESIEDSKCSLNQDSIDNFYKADNLIEKQINELGINAEYITIFASPNSIPDSLFRKCHETGGQFRDSLDFKYATINNRTINFGRIYGISISDVSSYISRDLFYDKISDNLYKDYSSGLAIGHSFKRYSENVKKIYDATKSSLYDIKCYTGILKEGCVNSAKVPLSDYSKKQFIIFGDHGYPSGWYETIKYKEVPELHLSYVFSHACSTNNFWEGFEKTMGVNMIRKGAIAYIGAVGISYSDNSEAISLKKLTSSNITLGEMNKELIKEFSNYKRDYLMIGDPTLKLNLKKVDWNGIDFNDYPLYKEEYYEGYEENKKSNISINLIQSKKEVYYPNEDVVIKVILKNNEDKKNNIGIEYEIFSESGYISEINSEIINLEPLEEKEINIVMEVGKNIPSEKYFGVFRIIYEDKIVDEKKIEFNVEKTLKDLDIEIKICEDLNCENESRIFSPSEKIYLNYISNEKINPEIYIIKPDLSYKKIELPYEFSSNETGNYKLLFNFSENNILEEEFAIIENIEIPVYETCNSNNVCENDENEINCPQDCIYTEINDTIKISLNKGWNLISIPILLKNNSIQNFLDFFINKVFVGYMEKNYWSFFPKINDFKEILLIEPPKAYLIKTDQKSEFEISGFLLENREIFLEEGINFISYPCKNEKNIEEVFGNIKENIESIETIDDGVKTYDPSLIEYSDLKVLKPNFGYIIKMKKQSKIKFNC